MALAIHGDAGAQRNFLERAVTFVVVKESAWIVATKMSRWPSHRNRRDDAQSLARLREAYFVRDFSEVAIAIV